MMRTVASLFCSPHIGLASSLGGVGASLPQTRYVCPRLGTRGAEQEGTNNKAAKSRYKLQVRDDTSSK